MKDLTELKCSGCGEFIGALGQIHAKKPYCYDCAHKLGYWKPLPVCDVVRIINGVIVNDPTRKHTEKPHNQNLLALNASNEELVGGK